MSGPSINHKMSFPGPISALLVDINYKIKIKHVPILSQSSFHTNKVFVVALRYGVLVS